MIATTSKPVVAEITYSLLCLFAGIGSSRQSHAKQCGIVDRVRMPVPCNQIIQHVVYKAHRITRVSGRLPAVRFASGKCCVSHD